METIDLKTTEKALYTAKAEPQLVDVPPRRFLAIDGSGDPNTAERYKLAVPALFTLAYGLRAAMKAQGTVYTVMPLEGLWWVPAGQQFDYDDKSNWEWTLLIRQQDAADTAMLDEARRAARRKKPELPLEDVRLTTLDEGVSAQILHVGPFADEPATVARLNAFIAAQGCVYNGHHHEIYLSDFNRTLPEKLRTIIRYPVRRA